MSSSFEAKDYQIPSKSKPFIDYHNLSLKDQTSLKSLPQHQSPSEGDPLKDHRLPKNQNHPPPPSQQQLPTRTLPSKDHHLLENLNQPPPPTLQPSSPPWQQPPTRTLYSNVEQPKKDSHAKLTSAEPVTPHPKNYLSQPDGLPPQQQQPPTRTLPSNIEQPYKQPVTLAKLTSAEPVTNPKKYLSQSDEAPPSQPNSPAQTLPSKDKHLLKNSSLPPPPHPPPKPPARTLPSNVEQPTKYKQNTNQVTRVEPETDYPEHYLSQPDGPPPPQPYPLPRTLSPNDQLKNVKPPLARNPPSNVEQQPKYQQLNNHVNQTSAEPIVTVYPEKYYLSPPPPPPKKCPCSIL